MSAQAYTNRRRIRAEASVVKVQYKKGVTVNNNAIYATINCLPNFEQLTYSPTCECPFNGRGPFGPLAPLPTCITGDIDGGSSGTGIENITFWIDGGSSETLTTICWVDGGNSGGLGYYDGGGAFSNPTSTIDGGNSGGSGYYNGGGASSNPTATIDGGNSGGSGYYNGGGASSNPTATIDGGIA